VQSKGILVVCKQGEELFGKVNFNTSFCLLGKKKPALGLAFLQ